MGLENASLWRKTVFDVESELEGQFYSHVGAFDDVQLDFVSRHLKKLLNGPCLRIFHAIVSCNRAGHSARFLEDVRLCMYFGILSN